MKQTLLNLLSFLRLTDDNNLVSLTNIAVIVSLVKLALAPQVGVTEIATLLLSLLAYTGKKLIAKQTSPDLTDTVTSLQSDLAKANSLVTQVVSDVQSTTTQLNNLKSALSLKQAVGK